MPISEQPWMIAASSMMKRMAVRKLNCGTMSCGIIWPCMPGWPGCICWPYMPCWP
eukprot:CAMPEP_0195139844 /NCGR_PEP_ID=MMETSP0448-20130528/160114_1 /TAXON_ID=66468 /ORGANISM="Heterocapsa triquestra, Strain CCMP 448" /LENGTH=54 /DNA_ID=CAMNT_0040178161 /DNA_START=56 /DNA_END=216 /DNA_ORIENTATION=-